MNLLISRKILDAYGREYIFFGDDDFTPMSASDRWLKATLRMRWKYWSSTRCSRTLKAEFSYLTFKIN